MSSLLFGWSWPCSADWSSWTCLITMSLSGNHWTVADPGYCHQTCPVCLALVLGDCTPRRTASLTFLSAALWAAHIRVVLETHQVAKEPLSQRFSWGAYCGIALHCQKGRQSRTINSFSTPGTCMNQWKTRVDCNSIGLKKTKPNEALQGVILETEDKKSIYLK